MSVCLSVDSRAQIHSSTTWQAITNWRQRQRERERLFVLQRELGKIIIPVSQQLKYLLTDNGTQKRPNTTDVRVSGFKQRKMDTSTWGAAWSMLSSGAALHRGDHTNQPNYYICREKSHFHSQKNMFKKNYKKGRWTTDVQSLYGGGTGLKSLLTALISVGSLRQNDIALPSISNQLNWGHNYTALQCLSAARPPSHKLTHTLILRIEWQ